MISAKYNTKNKYVKHTDIFLKETNYIPPILTTIDNRYIVEHEWYYTMIKRELFVFQFKDLVYNIPVANMSPIIQISPNNIYHGTYTFSDAFRHWNKIKFAMSGFISTIKLNTLEDILTLKIDNFKYKTLATDVPVSTDKVSVAFPLISLQSNLKYLDHLRSL